MAYFFSRKPVYCALNFFQRRLGPLTSLPSGDFSGEAEVVPFRDIMRRKMPYQPYSLKIVYLHELLLLRIELGISWLIFPIATADFFIYALASLQNCRFRKKLIRDFL